MHDITVGPSEFNYIHNCQVCKTKFTTDKSDIKSDLVYPVSYVFEDGREPIVDKVRRYYVICPCCTVHIALLTSHVPYTVKRWILNKESDSF